MKNNVRFWIVFAASLVVLMVPALTFLGVKDILPVIGYQLVEPPQKLTWKHFKSREFQTIHEKRFSSSFFLRGFMYRLRCQTMELANLGISHEGNDQNLGQFQDGSLFEYQYFNLYYSPDSTLSKDNVSKTLSAIGDLKKVLAENGVDMMFVMAADKVQMTKAAMPLPTSALFRKHHEEFQSGYARLLSDYGIPSFDTFAFLTNEAPRHAERMYPLAGTHWNALASSLVVDELLERLNRHSARPYAINHATGVEESNVKPARYRDDDLGRLLNLFYNPCLRKNKSYLPEFECGDFTPNDGSVIIFGDSFSWQLAETMKRAKVFAPGKIMDCDKRIPSANELRCVLPNLRLVVFVYMSRNMLAFDKDPRVGGKIEPFCKLLTEYFLKSTCLTLEEPVLFYSNKESGHKFFRSGLSHPESGWTWTDGHEALMRFHTASTAPKLSVNMECSSFHHRQRVAIEANGKRVLDDACGENGLEFTFDNPGAGKDIELKFTFPEAMAPKAIGKSADSRVLALKIRSLTVTESQGQ